MCFSAEASFTASAVLGCMGVATLKAARRTSLSWLAALPILFGLQQFCEGILWLYLPDPPEMSPVSLIAMYIFMGFAYLFWPVWIPFSLLMAEKIVWRKIVLLLCLIAGITLTSYFLSHSSEGYSEVNIVGGSIQYAYNGQPWKNYYGSIIIVSCFISSLRGLKIFGLLIGSSFLLSEYYYTKVFISVWCFFAAVISLYIYWVIRNNRD